MAFVSLRYGQEGVARPGAIFVALRYIHRYIAMGLRKYMNKKLTLAGRLTVLASAALALGASAAFPSTWSELFNSPVGDGVLVYFEKDGVPLADNEGRIAMVSSKDLRPGPRHVKWLQSIEVRRGVE